jgi:hypothetical protein
VLIMIIVGVKSCKEKEDPAIERLQSINDWNQQQQNW